MKIYIFATIAALSAVATTAAGDIPLQRGLQKCYSCSKKGQYWIYKNGDGKCEKKWCEEKDMCIYKKVIDNKCGDDDDDDDDDKKDCGDKEEDCCDCVEDECDSHDSKKSFNKCVKKECKSECRDAAECYYDNKKRYKKYARNKC
jgi:hypothetical protein